MKAVQLTDSEKSKIFWASFLSLLVAGIGFSFRILNLETMMGEVGPLGNHSFVTLFFASLWPVAITMMLFSFIVDAVGEKPSMFIAFGLQALSVVVTATADSVGAIYWGSILAGLGHGVVEAVINPVCMAIYPNDKSTKMNILHAAWPAGIVAGGLISNLLPISWEFKVLLTLIPILVYGFYTLMSRFPKSERVQAGVSYKAMLQEFGGLGFFIVSTLLFFEIAGQSGFSVSLGQSILFGIVTGAAFGLFVKSWGKPFFFFIGLIMIPLATTELGTDGMIAQLTRPSLGDAAVWAIVFSAFIMLFLRLFAGSLLSRFSPPAVLVISSLFSAVGLMLISSGTGAIVWLYFVIYAIGQTYYWPTILGLVGEQFPKGGAMTLNSVTAIGLLAVGIIGGPTLGGFQGISKAQAAQEILAPEVYEQVQSEAKAFGIPHSTVDDTKLAELASDEQIASINDSSNRGAIFKAGYFPIIMGLSFFIVVLYFRSRGGYKPVALSKSSD